MAHDENGNYKDEKAQAQWKDAFSESLGASLEGRHQLMPKVYREPLKTALDRYDNNEFDESEHVFRGKGEYNKRATLMLAMTKVAQRERIQPPRVHPALLLAMTKKASNSSLEKKADMEDILKQYVDPWAQQAYSGMYGPQGLQQQMGLPGSPWMYSTGLGAGAGGLIGGYFNNPLAGSLIGGGLGYLLNQWAKSRYGQQQQGQAQAGGQPAGTAAPKGQVGGQPAAVAAPQGNDVFNQFDPSKLVPGTVGGQTPPVQFAGQQQQQAQGGGQPAPSKITIEGSAADSMQPIR